jgi:hypothetical protein
LVPSLGRWLNPDPLALHALCEADLNLYAYVRGKVFSSIDHWGIEDNQANTGTPPVDSGDSGSPGCGSGGCIGEVQPDISARPQSGGGEYTGSGQKASEVFAPKEQDAPKVFGAQAAMKPAHTARERAEQSWLQAKASAYNHVASTIDTMMPIVPSMPKMAQLTWYASSELRRYELSADSQAAIGAMTAIETGATMGGGAILATGVEMVQVHGPPTPQELR